MSRDELRNALRRLVGRLADARHEVNLMLLDGELEEELEEVELRESITSCMEVTTGLLDELED